MRRQQSFTRADRLAGHAEESDGALMAPMPGTVLDVRVAEGQQVVEGDVLGVLEAMKMELAMKAPFAGTVTGKTARVAERFCTGTELSTIDHSPPRSSRTSTPP
mgnify:CR=1 FL=1